MKKIVVWLIVLTVIFFPVTALEAARGGRDGNKHSDRRGYRGDRPHQRAPSGRHYNTPSRSTPRNYRSYSNKPHQRAPSGRRYNVPSRSTPHNYRSYGGHSYPRYSFPFFAGIGFLGGHWVGSYYYSYPYNNLCRRFIPNGEYHLESQQDPSTGNFYQIEVPSGYWENVPCQP